MLLQVEKSPKPVASCAMPAGPGMKIKTDTPLVKRAREGVMEFLLVSITGKMGPSRPCPSLLRVFCPLYLSPLLLSWALCSTRLSYIEPH